MKFICLFILFSFCLPIHFVFSQNLQFYRQDMTFEIKDGFFYVDGIYNFCNNGDKKIQQVLFYPFPLDSAFGEVDSINVFDINANSQNIIANLTEKGFNFKLALNPYEICKYKISYRQKLLKNKAEYILVTAQKWGKPFDYAFYKLITPAWMKMISISYNPDSIKQINNKVIYYWNEKDFVPPKNMIFYFN